MAAQVLAEKRTTRRWPRRFRPVDPAPKIRWRFGWRFGTSLLKMHRRGIQGNRKERLHLHGYSSCRTSGVQEAKTMKKLDFAVSIQVERATGDVLAAYLQIRRGKAAAVREFADGNAF